MQSSQFTFLLFAAVVAQQQSGGVSAYALQNNVFSRKSFVSHGAATFVAVASGGGAIILTGNPAEASAREGILTARIKDRASAASSSSSSPDATSKGGNKELFRGGKNLSDALHNGTDLDVEQAAVAGGLLDKLGLGDITPDKGDNSRAPPKARR